jgi:hypothetical protein
VDSSYIEATKRAERDGGKHAKDLEKPDVVRRKMREKHLVVYGLVFTAWRRQCMNIHELNAGTRTTK